jgi:hypothetical protein
VVPPDDDPAAPLSGAFAEPPVAFGAPASLEGAGPPSGSPPSGADASQPFPEGHAVETHEPLVQTAPALHATPHPPQLLVSLWKPWSSYSHPVIGLPSQSEKPAWQPVIAHAPAEQAASALANAHTVLQLPQFLTSEANCASENSQPSAAVPLQSLNPLAQLAMVQTPVEQAPRAFGGAQTRLQPPQSFGSEAKDAFEYSQPFPDRPSQSLVPAGQVSTWQEPAMQLKPDWQILPQDPQCSGSVAKPAVLYSQPFTLEPSQSMKPVLQLPKTQRFVEQVAFAFGKVQRLPHPPQFAGSLSKDEASYSQPVENRPSQLLNP